MEWARLNTSTQLTNSGNETLALGDFSNGLGDEGASGSPGDSTDTCMVMGGRWENPAQVEDPNASGWAKTGMVI